MRERLTLIGTNHKDIRGCDRLTKLLNHINPEIITLEFTEDRVNEREKTVDLIYNELKKKSIDEELLDEWFEIYSKSPYEFKTCEQYSKEKKVPLYYID
ncbi:MAG: hypothetical protein AABX88_03000 [Nanoarchaeota archaeon]